VSQDEIVRALADPALHAHRPASVEHVQTHISHVFLAGPYAYKLKKAVRFPFLDFSTPERRAHFCREEVRLNRRLSPAVYLGVVPVTRDAAGRIRLGGDGAAVDHVVAMRRLPHDRLLTSLLATGRLQDEHLTALARRLAAFHAAAPAGPEVAVHATPERLRVLWRETLVLPASFVGRLLAPEDLEILADFGPTFVQRHQTLLEARVRARRVREGHGDLHAEHVCFLDAPPPTAGDLSPLPAGVHVFDAVEFSHALRCNDVASEVAFLAMDLEALGHPARAAAFVDAYAAAAGDRDLHALLPFYACYRACVRGKVEGLKAEDPAVAAADREATAARARHHFALALRYACAAAGPALVACTGLSGSGKTTVATALASATGFALVGSDALRARHRERAPGAPATAGYDRGRYTPAARAAIYDALGAEADATLGAGRGVVADATFIRRADRERLRGVARRHRRPLLFLDCRADEAAIRARLGARDAAPSLSDARWETFVAQRERAEPLAPDEPHVVVDTTAGLATARAAALRGFWRWRWGRPPAEGARP
jgi:hypothetical protein